MEYQVQGQRTKVDECAQKSPVLSESVTYQRNKRVFRTYLSFGKDGAQAVEEVEGGEDAALDQYTAKHS